MYLFSSSSRPPPNIKPKYPQIFENVSPHSNIEVSIQYTPAVTFNELINTYDEVQEEGAKFLDIEINSIKFICHYFMTLEELLVEKLLDVNNDYIKIQNSISNICKQIKVNRNTKNKYKADLLEINDKRNDIKFDPTFRKYIGNLILLKEKYIELLKSEKGTVNKIICLWSDIEMIRQKRNCKRSSLNVEIIKTILNDDEYEQEYSRIFDLELSDLLDKIEYEYVTKYMEYKKQKYEHIRDKKNIAKPKLNIDENIIRHEVQNLVHFLLNKEKVTKINIYQDNTKNKKQKQMNDLTVTLKVYVDDIYVCETKPYSLNITDIINISDHISVQIMPNNTILTLKIYENDDKQCACNINILDINKNIPNPISNIVNFYYECNIEPSDISIGCGYSIKDIARANGVRLKSSNIFKDIIRTKCRADIKIGWDIDLRENQPQVIRKYYEVSKKIKQCLNTGNRNMLKEIIEMVYDQDISENNKIMNTIKNLETRNSLHARNNTFFVEQNALDNERFKLLHLRNIGEFSDIDRPVVPLYSHQISTEQLHFLQDLKDNQLNSQYFNKELGEELHPIELQRYIGVKYTRNINKNILKILNENLMRNSYKDVVCDFKDLSLR